MARSFRNGAVSDANLYYLCTDLVRKMERDEAQFIARGISVADRTALRDLATAFVEIPTDQEYVSDLQLLNSERLALRSSLSSKLRTLISYFDQAYDRGSAEYKSLEAKNFANQTDSKFISICLNVAEKAQNKLSSLSSIGLTQSQIDTLLSELDAFKSKILEISDFKVERQKTAELRVEKANELYQKAAFICKVGKLMWFDQNEALYNDYVLAKMIKRSKRKKNPAEDEED